MKKYFVVALIFFVIVAQIFAQVGKVGINTTIPAAMLHVKDSSVLFTGLSSGLPGTPGNPPASGNGVRTFWYPDKAAFRTGRVTGTEWDKTNIGNYSFAAGINNIASGVQSVAFGSTNKATGDNAVVMNSTNKAGGLASFAAGVSTFANGASTFAIGRFNDSLQAASTIITPTTPLFMVGNGSGVNSRSNAFTILSNGNMGVGVSGLPQYRLQVNNTSSGDGGYVNGIFIQNTSSGEAALSYRNSLMPSSNQWTIGLDQNPNLAFNYGTSFSASNTKMVLDSIGRLGIGTVTPATTALVDMQSTTKGILIPRLTTTERMAIAFPATGLLVFDSSAGTIYLYDGNQWLPFALFTSNSQNSIFSSRPSYPISGSEFGQTVAIDGDFAIVGAPNDEDISFPGFDEVGTVTFYKNDGGWHNISKHTNAPVVDFDHFGWAVDMDGSYAIAGTPYDYADDKGSVSIYNYNGTSWSLQQQIAGVNGDDLYGYSVSIQDDIIAIGAPGFNADQGKVEIRRRTNTTWNTIIGTITTMQAHTGSHVILSGNKVLVGAFNLMTTQGHFYIYKYDGTNWAEEFDQGLTNMKSIAFEGDYVAVGYQGAGMTDLVQVYWFNGTSWGLQSTFINNDSSFGEDFGRSISISGEKILVGNPLGFISAGFTPGVAYLFSRNGSHWIQTAKILDTPGANGALFGQSVDIQNGNYIIGSPVASDNKGAVGFGKVY